MVVIELATYVYLYIWLLPYVGFPYDWVTYRRPSKLSYDKKRVVTD